VVSVSIELLSVSSIEYNEAEETAITIATAIMMPIITALFIMLYVHNLGYKDGGTLFQSHPSNLKKQ